MYVSNSTLETVSLAALQLGHSMITIMESKESVECFPTVAG